MASSLTTQYEDHFVNYFATCGLDATEHLTFHPEAELSDDTTPLRRAYQGRILAYYPRGGRKSEEFFKELLGLALPHGVRFCTQKDNRDPSFHSFAGFRNDASASRVDACVLTFWEEVTDKGICEALHNYQTQHHFSEVTRRDAEKAEVVSGRLPPFPPVEKLSLVGVNARSGSADPAPHHQTGSSHTLPRRSRASRSKYAQFYDHVKDTLYVTKCICVITPVPAIYACDKLLRGLYSLVSGDTPPPLPIESYVYWLLHEIPCPPPHRCLKFSFLDSLIVCQRPGSDELPFFDYPIHEAINLLGVEKFLKVFSCVLLEQQVLLCSRKLQYLMLLAESLRVLLFPFEFSHVYVPIVPYNKACLLDVPLPFIMGILVEDTGFVFPTQILQSNMCIVNIDTAVVEMPEDCPSLPDRTELVHEILVVMDQYKAASSEIISKVEGGLHQDKSRDLRGHSVDRRQTDWHLKRMSKSFDDDTLWLNPLGPVEPRAPPTDLPLDVLQSSEPLARVTAIARKAGISIALLDSLQQELEQNGLMTSPTFGASCQRYFWTIRTNNAIREIFLNRFLYMLFSYENFVLGNYPDRKTFETNRDMMQNFDRTSFLSDQAESHLEFLAAFIETQMFTSFVDAKILSQWDKVMDPTIRLFNERMTDLRQRFGDAMVRTPTYETCHSFSLTESMIVDREESSDYIVPAPHTLETLTPDVKSSWKRGFFPILDPGVLEGPNEVSKRSPWKQRYKHVKERERLALEEKLSDSSFPKPILSPVIGRPPPSPIGSRRGAGTGNRHSYHPGMEVDMPPAEIAQKNWKFVEQLLRETKAKTKKMLVDGMGKDAIELGHASDLSVAGVEENTLVASFCDLLERVWAHGVVRKKGKSAIWSHILSSHDLLKGVIHLKERSRTSSAASSRAASPAPGSPARPPPGSPLRSRRELLEAMAPLMMGRNSFSTPATQQPDSPSRRSSSRPRGVDPSSIFAPLSIDIAYDLKNIFKMTEIKTDVGYARAFVRLALERKLLHKHLKTLLSNAELLRKLYKRYAFLRCEEEREQFLFHVLSLHAAEFRCFTNTFTKTKMQYQVILVAGGKLGTQSTANLWIRVGGSLSQSVVIHVPKNRYRFYFDHKNFGILSTLRVGHDNSGLSPRLYLDFVAIRNEITGHAYRFPCGRWIGRGVDDDSIERLLVAEPMQQSGFNDRSGTMTPPRTRSPSLRRMVDGSGSKLRISEVQQWLGDAVNRVVKHFYRPNSRKSALTQLLCGDRGLIWCLEQAFLVGFRSSRFFRQVYPWDYVEKVANWFSDLLLEDCSQMSTDQRSLISQLCYICSLQVYPWDYVEKVANWFSDLLLEDCSQMSTDQRSLISQLCYICSLQVYPWDYVEKVANWFSDLLLEDCSQMSTDQRSLISQLCYICSLQVYPWDYVEKVANWFSDLLLEDCSQMSTDQRSLISQLCYICSLQVYPWDYVEKVANWFSDLLLEDCSQMSTDQRSLISQLCYICSLQVYPWDYVEKVANWFSDLLLEDCSQMSTDQRSLISQLCYICSLQVYPWDYVEKVANWFSDLLLEDCSQMSTDQRSLISQLCYICSLQVYPWDYVEKVANWFSDLLLEDCSQMSTDQRSLISQLCYMANCLNQVSSLGKVEKFNAFLIIAIRDHILAGILPLMAWTPITSSMYEETSFLRSPHYLTFLSKLLSSLQEFEFDLEPSLTWGINI